MPDIELLDQLTIDKIAAGEVVERPSSVAKELIENAIDAGATAITVEIKDGGISFLRITDNGCGMDREAVPKAFLRHATSKLRQIQDLETISSLGFRGEALSSISSVAMVELLTKTRESLVGIRYCIEGGVEKALEEAGLPDGTTIIIRNLFYNTPAREKFLKSPQTEGSYIATLMEHMALSHPEIAMRFIQNNVTKLQTSGNGSLKDIIYQIYGRDIIDNLMEINQSNGIYSVRGFIGKPVLSRGNRNYETYFINGRYVKNKTVAKAIEEGYKNYMMVHQFPFLMVFIDMDGKLVDVNVHPAKAEVRFSNEIEVYNFLKEAFEETLKGKDYIPHIPLTQTSQKNMENPTFVKQDEPKIRPEVQEKPVSKEKAPEIFEHKSYDKMLDSYRNRQENGPEVMSEGPSIMKAPMKPLVKDEINRDNRSSHDLAQEPVKVQQLSLPIEETDRVYFKLVGQIFDTYWVMEYDGKMYLVDQHAAHEKVNYERFVKRFQEKSFVSQNIVPPMVVTLSPQEMELVDKYPDMFVDFGFEISHFGGKDYTISAVPTDLYGMDEKKFFRELLDEFMEHPVQNPTPDLLLHKLATVACKASIKGHDKISFTEAEVLLKELFSAQQPYHCPHGRPTMISITKNEIEKMFKRIV